jgi:hypothetical protein
MSKCVLIADQINTKQNIVQRHGKDKEIWQSVVVIIVEVKNMSIKIVPN